MIKSTYFSFIFIIFLLIGCSSSKSSPVIPENPQADINLPTTELNTDESSHNLLGTWTLTINHETLSASIQPNRALNTHYNVTTMIPAPTIQVNSWDPIEEVVDVDVTLHNPFLFDAYDVRLIIYADDAGHLLLNPDDWTHLFDIPEGLWSNPFRAYAKSVQNRRFAGTLSHQENLQIKCPGSNFTVQFAVDASYPGNCEEPYEISNFRQDVIYDQVGSSGWIYVDVFDWQDDVSEVKIDCEAIAGATDILLIHDTGNTWKLELVNNNGAPPGEYGAILFAKSAGSGSLALIDRVAITVSQSGIPLNPVTVGEFHTPMATYLPVSIENGILYAVSSIDGIVAMDITNPSTPEIISILPLDIKPKWLVTFGNYALTAYTSYDNDYSELEVVDISDPYDMESIASFEINSRLTGLSFDGNYVSLTTGDDWKLLDLSTPSNPFICASLDLPNGATEIKGNYVFVDNYVGYNHFVVTIDINDPYNPVIINEYIPMADYARLIFAMDGQILYVGSHTYPAGQVWSYVEAVDISDPFNPTRLDYFEFTTEHPDQASDYITGIEAQDGRLIFGRNNDPFNAGQIYFVDASDPNYLQIDGFKGSTEFGNCAINGDFCYLGQPALPVLDFTNLSLIDYYITFDVLCAHEIKVSENNIAYIENRITRMSNELLQLYVIDVNNPQSPQMLSLYSLDDYALGDYDDIKAIDSFDDYVVLTLRNPVEYPDRILILDASVPNTLTEFSFLDVGCHLQDMHYYNNYLYVAAGNCGLLIYDVSNPQTINPVGEVILEGVHDLTIKGNYAYILGGEHNYGLYVIDISDPYNPLIVGDIDITFPSDIEVQNNIAFIYRYDRICVINVSIPSNPVQISEFHISGLSTGMTMSGNFIYLTGSGEIWDVSDPQNPQYISEVEPLELINDCQVIDNYAYVSCSVAGLHINKLW